MSTTTAFLNLLKPDGADFINEATQLNNNLDAIDTFASGTDARLDAIEASSLGVGYVAMFYGTEGQIPADYLEMNGQSFSAITYPLLAAHLGSTTMPDLRDVFPIGASTTKDVGETGGSATKTLTVANMPPHSHTAIRSNTTGSGGSLARGTTDNDVENTNPIGSNGSGTAFDIMPPWFALRFIMKAK